MKNIYEVSKKANESTYMPMNRMGTKCLFSFAKVTWQPSFLTKNETSSLFPDITIYMIERAKSLVQEKGVYLELEAYTGQPIAEKTEKVVIQYYINDDFNCS